MAVIWGLPTWVWIVVASVVCAACGLIARVLARAFVHAKELLESLETSRSLLASSLEATRDEMTRASENLARLGRRGEQPAGDAWRDW